LGNDSTTSRLIELANLKSKGLISDAEFVKLKSGLVATTSAEIGAQAIKQSSEVEGAGCFGWLMLAVVLALVTLGVAAFLADSPKFAGTSTVALGAIAVVSIVPLALAIYIYLLPAFLAFKRQHPNRFVILALNLLLGVTILGWVILLIWALRAAHVSDRGNGGESGLNVFANDARKVQIAAASESNQPSDTSELEALASLHASGDLSTEEFSVLKAKFLAKF